MTESEELLRATVDGMLEPHLLIEAIRDEHGAVADLRILVANRAALDYWGLLSEQVVGRAMLQIFPGIRAAGLFAVWVDALETGNNVVLNDFPYNNEILGEILHYDLRASGAPGDRLSLSWRDISDRHRAARTAAEVRRHYQLLAENASDVVFRSDVDGRLVWVSPSVTKVLGWDSNLLIGRRLTDLSHPLDRDVLRAALAGLASGDSTHVEVRMRKTDQGHRWMGVSLRTALDEGEWSSATFGTFRDITAQREVMDALQDSRLELAEAQRLAGAGSWTYDPRSDTWQWSEELLRIYGLPAGLDGLGLEDLLAPISNETEVVAAAESAMAAGRTADMELDLIRPDGDVRRLQARIAPVYDHNGEIAKIRGTAVDVTELHRETEARARRTARHSDYLTRVEHTLRTHLSVVEGWAGILEASYDDLDSVTRTDAVGAIKRNAAALVGHVTGLMSEAAQHAKADTIVVEPIDVAEVTAGVAADYRGLSGRDVTVEPTSGVWALGSREAVDTVARHLVENAVRHTEDAGRVEVVTRVGPASVVELVVRDDGPGIADGVHLFTPFSKESRSAGHGLGLHVVRSLVEAMGGTVAGGNRVDREGAEFVVTMRGIAI